MKLILCPLLAFFACLPSIQGGLVLVDNSNPSVGPNATLVTTLNTIDFVDPPFNTVTLTLNSGTPNDFFGKFGNDYFFRSTDTPDVNSAIASSNITPWNNMGGSDSYVAGAQVGDDNWLYITSNVGTKSWAQVSISGSTFTVLRYVYDDTTPTAHISLAAAISTANGPVSSPRDVHFRTVNFTTGVVELHNYGASDVDLSGWRFCSQDDDQKFVYSSPSGLNGVTIEAGTSIFLHFKNDASGSDHINISAVGSFAGPLDNNAYALSLYFNPVSFGNGNTMADHIQWSHNGVDDTNADERSDEAENGGLWSDQSTWINTSEQTTSIHLTDGNNGELHGSNDYLRVPDFQIISVDYAVLAGDFTINFPDINNLVVDVERSTTLLPLSWTVVDTTSNNASFLTGVSGEKAFYRVVPKLP